MAKYMAVSGDFCGVINTMSINIYNKVENTHTVLDISKILSNEENDTISDITFSKDNQHMAIITSISKKLLVYNLGTLNSPTPILFSLPRTASKVRFMGENNQILIADKSGDVFIYDTKEEDSKGTKLLSHLSLLLDVLATDNEKFIITCDRDEKIKVSCYPNTYSIQTYCLGHKEFVKHLELLPHNTHYLISSSGDGTIKVWNYLNGNLFYNINTDLDIDDKDLQKQFIESMDQEGVEVNTLPIVHFAATALSDKSSYIAVMVHNISKVFLYIIEEENQKLSHTLCQKICLEVFPAAIQFNNLELYIYNDTDQVVLMYSLANESKKDFHLVRKIEMFNNVIIENNSNQNNTIKMLFKRKFDNLQEYLERKRQRLEKKN